MAFETYSCLSRLGTYDFGYSGTNISSFMHVFNLLMTALNSSCKHETDDVTDIYEFERQAWKHNTED